MTPRCRTITLFTLGVVLSTSLGGCGLGFGFDPARDESGAISEEGNLSVFKLRAGDCMVGDPTGELTGVNVRPCEQPHEWEVYEIARYDGDEYDPVAIDEFAEEACAAAFATFVGVPFEESQLKVAYLTPTPTGFSAGDDREITCLVGGRQSTSTLRGSNT